MSRQAGGEEVGTIQGPLKEPCQQEDITRVSQQWDGMLLLGFRLNLRLF